jgi:hypothetical protein
LAVVANRLENLRSIVAIEKLVNRQIRFVERDGHSPDRVLPTPLLKQENDKGNDESDEVALSEECFFPAEAFPCFTLLFNGRFDLCVFFEDGG